MLLPEKIEAIVTRSPMPWANCIKFSYSGHLPIVFLARWQLQVWRIILPARCQHPMWLAKWPSRAGGTKLGREIYRLLLHRSSPSSFTNVNRQKDHLDAIQLCLVNYERKPLHVWSVNDNNQLTRNNWRCSSWIRQRSIAELMILPLILLTGSGSVRWGRSI